MSNTKTRPNPNAKAASAPRPRFGTANPSKPKPPSRPQPPAPKRRKISPTKRITLFPHPPRPRHHLPTLQPSVTDTSGTTLNSAAAAAAAPAADRLKRLHAITSLLATLHARNKNQHRAQLWFKWLNLLRRRVAELLRLEVELFELRYGGRGDTGAGVGVDMGVGAREVRRRFEREGILEERKGEVEGWVRERVLPGASVAVSGLVGDGQFAGIGLVLMGVLADVRALVGGPLERVAEMEARADGGRGVLLTTRQAAEDDEDGRAEDTGQVVQRREEADTGDADWHKLASRPVSKIEHGATADSDVEVHDAHEADIDQEIRASSPFAAFSDDEIDSADPSAGSSGAAAEGSGLTTTAHQAHVHAPPQHVKPRGTYSTGRLREDGDAEFRPARPAGAADASQPHDGSTAVAVKYSEDKSTGPRDQDGHGVKLLGRPKSSKKQQRQQRQKEQREDYTGSIMGETNIKGNSKGKTRTKTKSIGKSKGKTKGKTKGKGNAIDDLFAGFK
ncbi:uncharacterized protein HMPREF1541_04497 [Cyphellophora europaea CBS 101466]|uniref:RNase MRP protein 1 RNA binding domain-containing protein n=1 Tax=Cyphellophora europaea (strain CBS 101466) TaxID=1220924 RepID=W2RUM1_CYPE1|nr:uncharacterized protein HMPREF1541_04497 [Cyphellophora europaea CBS 101466]ETN40221.1 hypothetical protein HMPREF1541_04497 [Cyphellophora europaea CBS 101466]